MFEEIKRWRWAILVVALLVAALTFAFWPEETPVDVAEVSRGPMAVGVTDDGVTRAKELYVVSAPVTGYLSRIELEAGDFVSRGALITRMSARPSAPIDARTQQELRAALAGARAGESGISASLAQAQRDLMRAEQLASRGFLPRAQLELARTRVAAEKSALRQSRAEVARILALLARPGGAVDTSPIPVRAPAGGQVLAVISESAGVVPEGTPLMSIGDPGQIEAVVDLVSREAVRVKPGDRVEFTQWGGDSTLIGHVHRIEPFGELKVSALGIEEQRVNVIVRFDAASAPRAERLGHGYQFDATIILWSAPDVLRVPIGALFRGDDGGWNVFVAAHGRAQERGIRIGHVNDEFGEVLHGLAVGDQVVLNPSNALSNRSNIKIR